MVRSCRWASPGLAGPGRQPLRRHHPRALRLRLLGVGLASLLLAAGCGEGEGAPDAGNTTGTDGGVARADAGGAPDAATSDGDGGSARDAEATGDDGGTTYVPSPSAEVDAWRAELEAAWEGGEEGTALRRSTSGGNPGSGDVGNRPHYHLSGFIDGLTQMWQATGDEVYLDRALALIHNTLDTAGPVGDGYSGWAHTFPTGREAPEGVPLYDSYLYRFVATLLRIMHQSPGLRGRGYQADFDEILAFTRQLWDHWENQGIDNFERSRVHMASHWARIGMELHIITGVAKYEEVFENLSFAGMRTRGGGNLRDNLELVAGAYEWNQRWPGDPYAIQDTDHAKAVISFVSTAHDNGYYWDATDIERFLRTMSDVVWVPGTDDFYANVDGSGGYVGNGRQHGWLHLGRYDAALQQRIRDDYDAGAGVEVWARGIAANNARILADGRSVYPENP